MNPPRLLYGGTLKTTQHYIGRTVGARPISDAKGLLGLRNGTLIMAGNCYDNSEAYNVEREAALRGFTIERML